MMQNFDHASAPLAGVVHIEASAGCGKTWNLCRLYRRLIVEAGHDVGQILVVTFTEAATAELKERIWRHLHEAQAETQDETARQRLQLALAAFDEAAVFTIHGFCHRALARLAFLAHQPLGEETVIDAHAPLRRVVEDFWRRHVLPLAGDEARWAIGGGIDLDVLTEALRAVTGKPLAKLAFGSGATAYDAAACAHALARAADQWRGHRVEALALLHQAVSEKRLNGRSYSEKAIDKAVQAWQLILNGILPDEKNLASASLLTTSGMNERVNKDKTPPRHALFDTLDALMPRLQERRQALAGLRVALLRQLTAEGPALLAQEKRAQRALSFDDMLWRLYEGVAGPKARPELLAALRGQFRSALIDEFQDTDPLQLAIFRALFAPQGPLFLVGDPKQAIYSFRGADLHSYFAGKALAKAQYALTHNQRSSAVMIDAVNRLFARNDRAFRIAGLDFTPAEKGVKPVAVLDDRSGCARPALAVWLLDDASGEEGCNKSCVQRKLAQATAAEIARLLTAARAGQITLDGRPLQPQDIAVLVRTHAQAALVADELAALDITAVRLAQEDVFASAEAGEMLTVLQAVAEPARFLRAALATVLLGRTSADLAALNADEALLAALEERFRHYRLLWLTQGFAPMWQRLLCDEAVIARLLALPEGERRATNVLHLTELLGTAAQQADGPDALLLWLSRQRSAIAEGHGAAESALLRLESDENLVRIVTKHRSKGLEYPIVFCPFLWDDGDESKRLARETSLAYHDERGEMVLDFSADEEAKKRVIEERQAERLRLIYVALTRAVHRCYIASGVRRLISAKGSKDCDVASMLNWLVAGRAELATDWRTAADPEAVRAAWQALLAEGGEAIGRIDLPQAGQPLAAQKHGQVCKARPVERLPRSGWQLTSFTSLLRRSQGAAPVEEIIALAEAPAADHDRALHSSPAIALDDVPAGDILHFPRGTGAGDCMHAVFERIDFGRPETWPAAIAKALRQHLPTATGQEALAGSLQAMLAEVLHSDLLPGTSPPLQLATVPSGRRLIEMEFHLAIHRAEGADFHPQQAEENFWRLLAEHGWQGTRVPLAKLHGYLRGRIDLIFEHEGRWYVLDWKSNHLGERPEDYAPAALKAAMRQHGYDLQALIYLLAMHRFLRRRLGTRYDAERQLGGAFYLFVRGVRRAWPQAGIWHWRPAAGLLDRLSELLAAGTTTEDLDR